MRDDDDDDDDDDDVGENTFLFAYRYSSIDIARGGSKTNPNPWPDAIPPLSAIPLRSVGWKPLKADARLVSRVNPGLCDWQVGLTQACVRVYARVLVPPNLYTHTYIV